MAPGQPWPVDANGQPIAPPAPPKSRRGLAITIGLVVFIVLLGATGVAALLMKEPPPTGEEAVRAYFEKLAAGDADGALTHVLPPETGSYRDQPLLKAIMIADPDARPGGLQVLDRRQTTLGGGEIRERVAVTYTVGETEFSRTILTRQQEEGQPFLLEEPFVELRVTGVDGRGYFVNGVPIDADVQSPIFAFPGTFIGTVVGNELFADVTVEAKDDGSDELPASVEIAFEQEIAAGAEEAVQAAVNAHLDGCLQDHTMQPVTRGWDGLLTACPFSLGGDVQVSVTWSFGRYPDIFVELSNAYPGQLLISTEVDGLVRYDVPPQWIDDEFEFSFTGVAFLHFNGVNVDTFYE